MDLPQEIVDEVIDNLAFDFETLKSTSLVRKSWTHRSHLRLFHFLPINSLNRLEKWSQSISPDPQGIASYPRSILLSFGTPRHWVEPATLDRFYDHFRSFSRVERLVISGFKAHKFDATSIPRYFGNFAATVRYLEVRTAIGTPASMLSFICAFPLLDDLAMEFPTTTTGGSEIREVMYPASVPSFKGKLRLLDMFYESNPLVELLCTLPLPFHTISVSSRSTGRLPQLVSLVNRCGKTLRSLHITRTTHAILLGSTGASLASCGALKELRVKTIHPMHLVATLVELLPTLSNAADLSRIVLDADGSFWAEADVDETTWNALDTVLAEHAEKTPATRRKRRLTLRFRTEKEGAVGEHDGWARKLVSLLVYFPKVGNVEYESKQ